jgi:hypothetical protein
MPKTAAVAQLPEILRNKSSHLVKLAGKIDSFSLLLRETPEGELKRSMEEQFHAMVFATRKEIRKYCPRYRVTLWLTAEEPEPAAAVTVSYKSPSASAPLTAPT